MAEAAPILSTPSPDSPARVPLCPLLVTKHSIITPAKPLKILVVIAIRYQKCKRLITNHLAVITGIISYQQEAAEGVRFKLATLTGLLSDFSVYLKALKATGKAINKGKRIIIEPDLLSLRLVRLSPSL